MAKRVDLTTEDTIPWIGDDVKLRVTLDENGSISGWTFDFVLKNYRDDDEDDAVVTQATSGVSAAINDAGGASAPGVIDVDIADTVTDTLSNNHDYWYAIRRADAGFETTLVHGIWRSQRR